jgi:hypothetical protein
LAHRHQADGTTDHLYRHGDDVLVAGQTREISILNRLVRWVTDAPREAYTAPHMDGIENESGGEQIELEADPRHAAVAAAALGLDPTKAKGVLVPFTRIGADERKCSPVLQERDERLFRSTTMRLAYLAGDRPEIIYGVKELARQSKEPRAVDMAGLKKVTRFLVNVPRLVLIMRRQKGPLRVTAYSGSDHAGCATTRRSTSCYALFLGGICLRVGSGTQKVVATSSAEAEFYAGTRAASALLGAQRLLGDLGMERRLDVPRLLLDATGGIGIILRRGIGAVKHLATSTLWLQGAAFRRELEIDKVGTDRNVSDIGTKPLTSSVFWRHLWAMGYTSRDGKSRAALESTWAAAQ